MNKIFIDIINIFKNKPNVENFSSTNILNSQASDIPLLYIEYYIYFIYIIYLEISTGIQNSDNNFTNLINQYNFNNPTDLQKLYNVIINLDLLSTELSSDQLYDRIDILNRLLEIINQMFNTNNIIYLQQIANNNNLPNNFVLNLPNFINLSKNLIILYLTDANNIYYNSSFFIYYLVIVVLIICLFISLYKNYISYYNRDR